tara:strand:- start:12 stop:455 length:444 start_codon:yes stop_codon:yes gene_type:complete
MNDIKERIKGHEGYRLEPYLCTEGHKTGGYGHKILDGEEIPTTQDGWEKLFDQDFTKAHDGATTLIYEHLTGTDFSELDDKKKYIVEGVLTEMCFQLGQSGVRKFRKMFTALSKCDFKEAGSQMRDSLWHKQTPARCKELSHIIQNL